MAQQQPVSPAATSLARALDQNETVKETVERSADELLVINAVLKQEIPPHVQTSEVAQAIEKTGELGAEFRPPPKIWPRSTGHWSRKLSKGPTWSASWRQPRQSWPGPRNRAFNSCG
jgi:hypothetical protein